jgi:hypothetical protein
MRGGLVGAAITILRCAPTGAWQRTSAASNAQTTQVFLDVLNENLAERGLACD